ncbi:MAG: hypothetical protein ACR2PO_00550, partial [Methyloligellaceae bacterium]
MHPTGFGTRIVRQARLCALALLALALFWVAEASALEPIVVDTEKDRIDVSILGVLYEGRGDRLQIET